MRFSLGWFQFCKGFSHVLAKRSAIVPEESVFHEAYAFAFYGMRDNATRPAGFVGQFCHSFLDGAQVMTVQLADCPSKSAPLVRQRIEIDDFFDGAKALNFVVIDDNGEVVKFVVRREECCLPNGTLITLAVANHAEDPAWPSVALRCKGHPNSYREPMTQ